MGCEDKSIVSVEVWNVFNKLMEDSRVKAAFDYIKNDDENTIAQQIKICEIPSPSFKEKERANYFIEEIKKAGIDNVHIDSVNNVLALNEGTKGNIKLYVGAHMDTVFDDITDIKVKKADGKLYAPGIGDNARGVASLLSVIRAIKSSGIRTIGDVVFCGSVCEECNGNMLGCKTIFKEHKDADGFLGVDGCGSKVIYKALGGSRYKVSYKGPGGHSYMHFGVPSAIHALGRAIAKIADLETKKSPKTTFTVGIINGGTAITSIASEASMFVDLRSESPEELSKLENQLKEIVEYSAKEENNRWGSNDLQVEIELIGDTPSGTQEIDSFIVQAALGASYTAGQVPDLLAQAVGTDANVPISLGVPAVCMNSGGTAFGGHSVNEWFDPKDAYLGPQRIMLTILSLVGVEGVCEPLLLKYNS